MTDKEMAKEYTAENGFGSNCQLGTILGIIKGVGICSFLAGLKEGKEKAKKEIEEELLNCYQGYPEKEE